jgi:hypothetical protein
VSTARTDHDIRPAYETEANRVEERRIADVLAATWDCDIVKLPRAYNLDFAAIRENRLAAWLEIKRRNRALRQFRCVFLSMQKVCAADELQSVTGRPSFFVVQFDDCLAYAHIVKQRDIEFRGRTDRNDWQDQEPVVVIPPEQFTVIQEVLI